MNKISDKEYLQNPLVEGVKYIITDDYIQIECSHTSWIKSKRLNILNKNDILNLYSDVRRIAKEKGTKIGRRGYKKFITENWEEYLAMANKYNHMFDQLIVECEKIKSRGIHYGCSDDVVLYNMIDIRNEYNTIFYSNTVYSKIHEIYSTLKRLYNDYIEYDKQYEKIYI